MNPAAVIKGVCLICLTGFIQPVGAQQNLFNVPSSDITIKSKPFFQQQINLSSGFAQLNTTFCWGLGGEAEIGVNVLGVVFISTNGKLSSQTNPDKNNPPVYPFYTINFQKAFTINKTFKVAFGTQAGYSVGWHFGGLAYSNLVTVFPKIRTKLITGLYMGSDSFLGPGERNSLLSSGAEQIGFQFGLEKEVIKEKLLLLAEGISGRHVLGTLTLGAAYFVSHHWAISGGYEISNVGNGSSNSLVVEFTYIPSAGVSKHIFRKGHHEMED